MARRLLVIVALASGFALMAKPAGACSEAGCVGNGTEVRPDFRVVIKHASRPLARVSVKIEGNGNKLTRLTSADGSVRIADLKPGLYWLSAELLGIGAAYECFHVSDRPNRKAKQKLSYTWGDEAPATQRVAGRLVDVQPGKSGKPLWDLRHPVEVAIIGARIKLQNPVSEVVYTTISDNLGGFSFQSVPAGTYVLHVEGGTAAERNFDATDQLINVSSHASRDTLLLKHRDSGGGSCGGTSLELKDAS